MKNIFSSLPTLLIAGTALTSCNTPTPQAAKPNVLVIISDDLRDWIGPYGGHPQAKTPNLDRLAANGSMTMLNAQCAASVCGPSRSALLTGLRPSTTGVYSNVQNLRDFEVAAAVPTLPQYFSQNGYFSLSTGKIFHKHRLEEGMDEGQWAFDLWEKEKGGFPVDKSKLPLNNIPSSGRRGTSMDWGATTVGKEETQDWLSAMWAAEKFQQDYDKPFFMMLGLTRPHLPFFVPQEYFDLYDLDSIVAPEFRLDDLDDILTPGGKKKFEPTADFLTIQQYDKFKEITRAYLACVSYVDDCVGLVLDALENSKYKDNTIIVFIGDHGWYFGEKLRFRKALLWEEDCRTPLIIKAPGITSTSRCERPVSFMDIYPTLAALCGLPIPEHCEGSDLTPLLKDPEIKWHPAVTTMFHNNHSIRSDRYRYNSWADGTEELYDHETDPNEWNNLIRTPGTEEIVQELRKYLPEINVESDVEPQWD
jgi:arylsulfatase A-like enzyme